jgi:hypothetical protein
MTRTAIDVVVVVEACRLWGWRAGDEGKDKLASAARTTGVEWCVESGTGKVDLDGGRRTR